MPCLENLVPVKEDLSTPRVQVTILDGAGIINMLRPGTAKTFQGYATDVFARQEDCMGHLDHLRRRHTSILRLGCHARLTCHWRVDATTGAICGPAVRSHQHRGWCEPGKETAVQQERESYWWSASYTGCTHPTHHESCLPSWSLLGPNDDACSRPAVAKWMGMEQEAWWWMEYKLDDPTRSIRSLQGTLAMWLQDSMHRTLQMSEGGSSVYSSLSVRWTVLWVTRLRGNSSLLFRHNVHLIDLQLDYNKLRTKKNWKNNSGLFDAFDKVVLLSKSYRVAWRKTTINLIFSLKLVIVCYFIYYVNSKITYVWFIIQRKNIPTPRIDLTYNIKEF